MAEATPNPQEVAVTDVRMPFLSMVVFMVKWAIAAIPAILILAVITAFIYATIPGIIVGLTSSPRSTAATKREDTDTRTVPAAQSSDEFTASAAAINASNEAIQRCMGTNAPGATHHCMQLLKACKDASPGADNDASAARAMTSCMAGVRP